MSAINVDRLPYQYEIPAGLEDAILYGDIAKLSEPLRLEYYNWVCKSVGLNPATKPFEFTNIGGKLVFYAGKNCAEQLRQIHKISLRPGAAETVANVLMQRVLAVTPDGREDYATGAVDLENLKGEKLANAFMKAETKGKRRATLSICGLGMLDETEIESIQAEPRYTPRKASSIEALEAELEKKAPVIEFIAPKAVELPKSIQKAHDRVEERVRPSSAPKMVTVVEPSHVVEPNKMVKPREQRAMADFSFPFAWGKAELKGKPLCQVPEQVLNDCLKMEGKPGKPDKDGKPGKPFDLGEKLREAIKAHLADTDPTPRTKPSLESEINALLTAEEDDEVLTFDNTDVPF